MIVSHVMEATGRLAPFKARLERATETAAQAIVQKLPIGAIDVVYFVNPVGVIPEVGVCGYAPTSRIVFLSVDPENQAFERAFTEEIPATLAHEFHHCMRWAGPGYGSTLLEALITEGLARDFEMNFRTGPAPEYHGRLSPTETAQLLERAQLEFFDTSYNHREWFFGSERRSIPKYAGYVLGHALVREYCLRTGKTSAELWSEPATSFVERASPPTGAAS